MRSLKSDLFAFPNFSALHSCMQVLFPCTTASNRITSERQQKEGITVEESPVSLFARYLCVEIQWGTDTDIYFLVLHSFRIETLRHEAPRI